MTDDDQYAEQYLRGIEHFNVCDFFEAHEVWEDLWMRTAGEEKRFYQGLIQAAVGLCHFCNGNVRGAIKLYNSSRDYMTRCGTPFLGLDGDEFWRQMSACFAELLAAVEPDRRIEPNEDLLPTVILAPPPDAWPDPAGFLHEEEEAP